MVTEWRAWIDTLMLLVIVAFDLLIWWDGRAVRKLYEGYFNERRAWRLAQRKSREGRKQHVGTILADSGDSGVLGSDGDRREEWPTGQALTVTQADSGPLSEAVPQSTPQTESRE